MEISVGKLFLFATSFLFMPTFNRCTIQVPALGNVLSMGALYDIRTSRFSLPIFRAKLPAKTVRQWDMTNFKSETRVIGNLEDKCSLLNLEASVSLGILSGLTQTQVYGFHNYLNKELNTRDNIEITHLTTLITKEEYLKLSNRSLKTIWLDALKNTRATHMVTGFRRGANVMVTFLQPRDNYVSADQIHRDLWSRIPIRRNDNDTEQALLTNIPPSSVSMQLPLLPGVGPPLSFAAVKMYLGNMSNLLKDIKGGTPISYTLTPLSVIRSLLGQEQRAEVYKESITNFELDSWVNVFRKIDDHRQLLEYYGNLFTQEFIPKAYSATLAAHQANFRKLVIRYKEQVKQFLVESRSTNETVNSDKVHLVQNELENAITGLTFPELEFKKFLHTNFREAGIPYVGRNNFLEIHMWTHKRFYCLLLPEHQGKTEFNSRYLYFMENLQNGTIKVVVDCAFNHSACLGQDVTEGRILEYRNYQFVNADLEPLTNQTEQEKSRGTSSDALVLVLSAEFVNVLNNTAVDIRSGEDMSTSK